MKNCLLLGYGGREAIMAKYLSKKYKLFTILPFLNPSIHESIIESNGKFWLDTPFNKELVKEVIKTNNIELCVVNNDNLLAAGLIDIAQDYGIKTFGPTKEGARIEWDKDFALSVVKEVAPEVCVKSITATSNDEIQQIIETFIGVNFVVKPNGLTAGKGVKVGGDHFLKREEGIEYARQCVRDDGIVVLQEKVLGNEFTIMGITDGKTLITAPATYDYPYRYDKDEGPGTGGMGCFSQANGLLPFLTEEDVRICANIMEKVIKHINQDGIIFNGILNGGFFKTEDGIKFMEFNARIGDPEALNLLTLLETPFQDIVQQICFEDEFNGSHCEFKKQNSYTLYVVSKDYAISENFKRIYFDLDVNNIRDEVDLYFSSVSEDNGLYQSESNSRLFALVAIGDDLIEIKNRVDTIANKYVDIEKLDFRKDITSIHNKA